MSRHYLLMSVIVLLCLSACGKKQPTMSDSSPGDDAVAVAVAATLTALPTATPYLVEVTRIVQVTPTPASTLPATGLPTRAAPAASPRVADGRPVEDEPTDFETEVIALVNQARKRNGLAPYHMAKELGWAARGQSAYMAATDHRSHIGAEGTTYRQRIQKSGYTPVAGAEEAIGWGFTTPQDMVTWWLDDPFHRPILLSAEHTEMGVGYTFREEWEMHHYWVAVFGSRRESVAMQSVEQREPGWAEPLDDRQWVRQSISPPEPGAPKEPTARSCPTTSTHRYATIPMTGIDVNHPDALHGDWNLTLRGYTAIGGTLQPIEIAGPTDPGAPHFSALFGQTYTPDWRATYRVNDWDWGCSVDGCQGRPLQEPEVTLLGIATGAQQPIYPPARAAEIYAGGYIAAVLYADMQQVTLAYTRDGSVANGYSVHLANFCVDPNLVTAYQTADANGRNQLPALRMGEQVGTTQVGEFRIAIRDRGRFMDPRSRKDWWQ